MKLDVRDLMTERVLSLRPEDDLATLKDLMDEHGIRHVPVVNADNELVGLVTRRDLARAVRVERSELPLNVRRDVLGSVRIEEAMTRDVATTEPEQDIREAAQVMLENKFGCLPVVVGRRLVGILTEADFVRFLAEGH